MRGIAGVKDYLDVLRDTYHPDTPIMDVILWEEGIASGNLEREDIKKMSSPGTGGVSECKKEPVRDAGIPSGGSEP